MLSLVDLNYPNPLLAFFEGFEFALLSFPEDWNPIDSAISSSLPATGTIPEILQNGGFYSSYIIVQ